MRTFRGYDGRVGRRTAPALALATIALAAIVGCSSNTPGTPTAATGVTGTATTPSPTPTSSAASTQSGGQTVHDLGDGLKLTMTGDAEVETFQTRDNYNCTTAQATVQTDQGRFGLWLIGKDCPQDSRDALNGNHGQYLKPPTFATDVSAAQDVPIGSLVTFHQKYTECTNSCNDYDDAIGLVTLTDPADPDMPVLMVLAPRDVSDGTAAVADLIAGISTS